VQCKCARRVGGVLVIKLDTNRCTPRGYVRTTYTASEVDAIGAFSAELGRCYLIPIAEVAEGRAIHLRLEPTLNNQAQKIRWARDYEFETSMRRNWLRRPPYTPEAPACGR
jgi:PD-(D/E)XK endonuclease